ncbi:acyl-CoA synthetase, putative [Ixodes scapularis]|uniref:Acyl-CoA synthetase, putative n=1 Tax=Ixodes scapularis TaxID=6945 RepID=B7Q2I1_IXOSC|nr:acyl-CoA synthetase, putative [Ixodes scapularis]|eukprot:XP_002410833.1 acyl-CoA synthetase, putative [Ixodes scapularis]
MLRTGTRFDTVRNISVAGTTLNESVARRFRTAFKNVNLINSYSQTEACGVLCFSHEPGGSAQFVGFPAPMVDLKFIDVETGKKVGPNEPGELCYKIPSVMRSYYKNPKKMAQFIDDDGWCHSGDLAYYGEDGSVYLVERMENLITCMGMPVIPAELENLLLSDHDDITEVAVVGLPHQKYGQVAAAFIALNKPHRLPENSTREMFLNTLLANCPMHKHPHGGIYLIDCLPKKPNGKVDQEALKAYALSYDDGKHQELKMSEAYP